MKHSSINIFLAALMLACTACDFLDIVPDNVATIDNAFSLRVNAEKYLFTCYSYLPAVSNLSENPALEGGDELVVGRLQKELVTFADGGWNIREGNQNSTQPYCDYWTGTNVSTPLFQGIRDCNVFIERIHEVPDIEEFERNQWIDEVKFLKAYYHFYLVRMYGPVPIKDTNLGIDASVDAVHVYRNSLDECFDYIVNLLDEVITSGNLPNRITSESSDMGRITVGVAKAIKAQVLIYAASPLFCGNTDYRGYADNRGVEIFCPEKTEAEKQARWRAAADACKEAIEYLEKEENGSHSIYNYTSTEYTISEPTRYILSIRNSFTETWNKEIIWAYTKSWMTGMQLWSVPVNSLGISSLEQGVLGVPLQICDLFYTKNGVPIEEDKTWDYTGRFELTKIPTENYLLLQPGYVTVRANIDREYRFYADLAFDGSAWFGNGAISEDALFYINAKASQTSSNVGIHRYNLTGVWPKKYVNYKTAALPSSFSYIYYPFPFITMSSLYLYYAEALNECGEDASVVLPWVDVIRARAGLEGVADSWTKYSRYPARYTTKEGLRQIIHRERTIEMIFEGERYWDLRRWKEAYAEYNKPLTGWSRAEEEDVKYYKEQVILHQSFQTRDYFSPIKNAEIFANSNTIQNPGW